jgi:hypothetical protein
MDKKLRFHLSRFLNLLYSGVMIESRVWFLYWILSELRKSRLQFLSVSFYVPEHFCNRVLRAEKTSAVGKKKDVLGTTDWGCGHVWTIFLIFSKKKGDDKVTMKPMWRYNCMSWSSFLVRCTWCTPKYTTTRIFLESVSSHDRGRSKDRDLLELSLCPVDEPMWRYNWMSWSSFLARCT